MGLPSDSGVNLHSRHPSGIKNLITDVPGVRVGHVTLQDGGNVNTGVTAILPHGGNIFREKVMANAEVLNGFGKSIGLVQVRELGTIETPIIMTNTLSVGTAFTGLCRYMLAGNPEIGISTGTVNCLITECNDGHLNDIRGLHVKEEHIPQAIENAAEDFAEGAVGAGTGMCCLGYKGGIGSASRKVTMDGTEYTIGCIVLANFGSSGNLRLGERFEPLQESREKDKGSCILLFATDLPLSERQLGRVCRRASIGLARTGSFMGNGSGDIAIAFTTANVLSHFEEKDVLTFRMLQDDSLDDVFEAAAEAAEESILSALWHAGTVSGMGNTVHSLQEKL